jgi:hypothetical protein
LHEIFGQFWTPPAIVEFVAHIIVAAIAALVILRWSAPTCRWRESHWVALAFAVLLDYCLLGFFVSKSDILNQTFHGLVSAIIIALMIFLTFKVRARAQSLSTQDCPRVNIHR